ncbi:hypothetical protein ACFQ1Q_06230 [Winogradskyella litorisediminis]|uniref:Uncharacterized protein n=1 Tax=Winogradskyella litorisediminis TaxID=1156618 RepID=A0ABW3N549_9FLAO
MPYRLISALTIIFYFTFSVTLIGQEKNEKEERIDFVELPISIQNISKSLPDNAKRIKYYLEVDGSKKSFEIKLKYKSVRYSIEFSEEGELEDIEVLSKFKDIEDSIKTQITSYFEKNFEKHKIIKLQHQYIFNNTSSASEFMKIIMSENDKTLPNFELIVEVKTLEKRELREITFNPTGNFISSRIVNPSAYDYVLY